MSDVKTIEHCTADDIGLSIAQDTPAEYREAIEKYFAAFAKPVDKTTDDGSLHRYCFNCEGEFDAFKQMLGMGVAFSWGLAHGEAFCSGCKWPARGHHFIKDASGEGICSLRNLFLLYHPDNVTGEAMENAK